MQNKDFPAKKQIEALNWEKEKIPIFAEDSVGIFIKGRGQAIVINVVVVH